MYYLLYISTPSGLFNDNDYVHLLLECRERNAALDITGMLLASDGYFMQLLEGSRHKVLDLYDRIARDRRHHDLFILDEGEVSRRYFPDWAMGFDYMNWLGNQNPPNLSPVLRSHDWQWSAEELRHRPIYLMDRFRRQYKRPAKQPAGAGAPG
ncbi:MAG: BLUF domain-containing protein [Acidobacteriota bacterium]|nr:BLUF domain-containing protein [Acidobacteriota bacterium]